MNFEALVASIREKRNEGVTSEGLVEWLKEALGEHMIDVKSVMEPVPEPTPSMGKKKGTKAVLAQGRDGKLAVIMPGTDHEGRVMFLANMRVPSSDALRYEIRSVIMDLRTLRVIASPPPPMVADFNPRMVNGDLKRGLYRAFKIRDGTVISLYTYKGKLCLGSASSLDISDQIARGGLSFKQMLLEAMGHHEDFVRLSGFGMTPGGHLRWKLPANISATVGFRHHNIHPMISDPMGVWFIRGDNHPAFDTLPKNEAVAPPESLSDPSIKEGYGIFLEAVRPFSGNKAKFNRICLKSPLYLMIEKYIYRLTGFARRKNLSPAQFVVFTTAEAVLQGEQEDMVLRVHEANRELASEVIKYVSSLESRIYDSMIEGGVIDDPIVSSAIDSIYSSEGDLKPWIEGDTPINPSKLRAIIRSRVKRIRAIDIAMPAGIDGGSTKEQSS